MSSDSRDGQQFVGGEEAWGVIRREPNLATQQLMAGLLTALMLEPSRSGDLPSDPVDLGYVVRASQRYLSRHAALQAVLDGEDLRWFPEDW